MNKLGILLLLTLLSITGNSIAQVSNDSINTLKQQKDLLETRTRINKQKIELAGLENKIGDRQQKMSSTAVDAQRAADENTRAATDLSTDPQNRKLARKAHKCANSAEKAAKKARSAESSMADLNADIDKLRKKIMEEESTLPVTNPPVVPMN